MDKLEKLLKHIPTITLICYICGFVIYKSFLLSYGIHEAEILNVKYIEAGLLYLVMAPFILTTHLITNKKLNYWASIATASFAFFILNSLFGSLEICFVVIALLIVIALNSYAYFIFYKYKAEKKTKLSDLTESPIFFFILVISSLIIFSFYYKEIKSNLGGGKKYKKILILNDKQENIIFTDSLMRTDTLTVIYESGDFIYFEDNNSIKSIRKVLINGEISIK